MSGERSDEPFEGYFDYLEKLRSSIGERVSIQESFNSSGGLPKVLLDVVKSNNGEKGLYPHVVVFGDDSRFNLRNVATITIAGDTPNYSVDSEAEDTLYVDLPWKKSVEDQWERTRKFQEENRLRFE
jgi:hypothetical protein